MSRRHRDGEIVHLRRGGTSLVARVDAVDVPCLLHWGADLGDILPDTLQELSRSLQMPGPDEPIWPHSWASMLPRQTAGWLGRPGLLGNRAGRAWALTYTAVTHEVVRDDEAETLHSVATDGTAGVEVTSDVELLNSGLLRVRASVRNLLDAPYEVTLLQPAVPVPADADELFDLAGSPTHERTPQRRSFDQGQWVREAWGGRPGHDMTTALCAGRTGFGFRHGRVWGVHLAWSGNQALSAEHSYTGWKLLRGGELLSPGEVVLRRDETYTSPWLYASWGDGLDQLSGRFHEYLRARPGHPRRPRSILLNTWEAVYFDLDTGKLTELAERAADLGIERFVLDDGWFHGRRDDTRALGDWFVDQAVFPDGLAPLVKTVQSLGMEFGLWFEPEMVNLNSDLARAHPEWVLATHAGPGISSRHQHVLDLSNSDAWNYIFNRLSSLVEEHRIGYIKWDHNRPLLGAGRGPDHLPGVHEQTLATYRMMAALRARFPDLEIESCCGGGGRVDLGIMNHAVRVWPSDCVDPHERHRIVRWTGLTLPLELIGTHVGASTDHTTGRRHTLSYRAGTAMFGHMGVELDLTTLSDPEREELRAWIRLHKQFRGLLHTGRTVNADRVNPALQLSGVVALDGSQALYRLSALAHSIQFPPGRVQLPGLVPDSTYRVAIVAPPQATLRSVASAPALVDGGTVASGRTLDEIGVMAPILQPDELVVLHAQLLEPNRDADRRQE